MRVYRQTKIITIILFLFSILFINDIEGGQVEKDKDSLRKLVPQVNSWSLSEVPQHYFPDSLFEYINGAAEGYLTYDFQELVVAQYEKKETESSLTVEVYDMGNEKNAFGIYSMERYPDSNFLDLGDGGYLEEGVLNFITGKYYVKLLCFECRNYEPALKLFAEKILENVGEKKGILPLIQKFPRPGLIKNSEKYVLRNFLGYSFLHDGYTARYRLSGYEFDCFIIEGKNAADARSMFEMYRMKLSQNNRQIRKINAGFHVKDPYYKNMYLAMVENFICGVLRIEDEAKKIGEEYLDRLLKTLKE